MSGLVKRKFFERFTTAGTYTIPAGVTMLWIEAIGPGGGGGGGHLSSSPGSAGGAGGGGSSMTWGVFNAADLSATLSVIIQSPGAGGGAGSAGAGGGRVHVTLIGTNAAGVDSGKYIVSSDGAGGGVGDNSGGHGGGGGAGTGWDGLTGSTTSGGAGGNPTVQDSTTGESLAGRGGKGGNYNETGYSGEYGGGWRWRWANW